MGVSKSQPTEVDIVGSSTFGRYPKISLSKTYNMFISDTWLVNYAGFKKAFQILNHAEGRGLFNSIRGDFILAVISSNVFRIDRNADPIFITQIDSTGGQVYIDENLDNQICIVDGESAYIYNYEIGTFKKQTLTFAGLKIIPGYVSYHNTFFLIASSILSENSQNWYAFDADGDNPDSIKYNTQFSLQTKPDSALVVKRLPGKGNNVIVLGSTVAEIWTQVGGLQNYSRVQSFNIDNGVISIATVASSDEYVCWLAQNENNSPFIMVTDGSSTKRISSDGIDYILSQIQHPKQSCAFFYRQDGHLFYQITFYDPADNLSLIYDFTTNLFFHVSDQNLNYHPARQVVFFQENTYFVSINDGSIYNINTNYLTYDYNTSPTSVGEEIPRIRICKTIRAPDSQRFRIGEFTFWIEQGVLPANPTTESRVDMSFSKNGNQSFSNIVGKTLNSVGHYRNQIRWHRMGQANEFTIQLRFWGFQRMVCSNGQAKIY